MTRVLFVCLHNAGRSQISEALFARAVGSRHEARSAGTRPAARVHPEVAVALAEVGVDIGGAIPELLTDELAAWADLVVTMGCGDECPVVPGKEYRDWDLADPAGLGRVEVRAIREEVAARVAELVAELDRGGG